LFLAVKTRRHRGAITVTQIAENERVEGKNGFKLFGERGNFQEAGRDVFSLIYKQKGARGNGGENK